MKKKPFVSIIIPVHNCALYLEETITNALQQTWENKEIIIVDDGSTDSSLNIAKNFENDTVKILSLKKGGAAKARNEGFAISKGDFIQYLDADDLMKEDKIEVQINRIFKEPYPEKVICAGHWIRFNGRLENTIGGLGPGAAAEQDMHPLDWLLIRPLNFMAVHSWLTPRCLIEQSSGWNESITLDDDGEFFTRIIPLAEKIIFSKESFVYYRTALDAASLSSANSCEKLSSAYLSVETYKKVLSKYTHTKIRVAVGNAFLLIAYHSFLECHTLYSKCMAQEEIKYAESFLMLNQYAGRYKTLQKIIGWRLFKRIKKFFNNRILFK